MGKRNSLKEIHRTTFWGRSIVSTRTKPALFLARINKYCTMNQERPARPIPQPQRGYFDVCLQMAELPEQLKRGGLLLVWVLRKEGHISDRECFRRQVLSVQSLQMVFRTRRFDSADTRHGMGSNHLLEFSILNDRGATTRWTAK